MCESDEVMNAIEKKQCLVIFIIHSLIRKIVLFAKQMDKYKKNSFKVRYLAINSDKRI